MNGHSAVEFMTGHGGIEEEAAGPVLGTNAKRLLGS